MSKLATLEEVSAMYETATRLEVMQHWAAYEAAANRCRLWHPCEDRSIEESKAAHDSDFIIDDERCFYADEPGTVAAIWEGTRWVHTSIEGAAIWVSKEKAQ